MEPDPGWLLTRLVFWIPLVLSLSVHEWAHAWSAWKLGDDTAARLGRLTLNPLSHIDPIGTLLLPFLGVPFGWARPVPVEPVRFRRSVTQGQGMMIVAAAGPISNFILASLCFLFLGFASPDAVWRPWLTSVALLNVILAVFNLIPIPPLDGSRIADALMPSFLRPLWERIAGMGPWLLAALLILPAFLIGVHPLARLMRWLTGLLS